MSQLILRTDHAHSCTYIWDRPSHIIYERSTPFKRLLCLLFNWINAPGILTQPFYHPTDPATYFSSPSRFEIILQDRTTDMGVLKYLGLYDQIIAEVVINIATARSSHLSNDRLYYVMAFAYCLDINGNICRERKGQVWMDLELTAVFQSEGDELGQMRVKSMSNRKAIVDLLRKAIKVGYDRSGKVYDVLTMEQNLIRASGSTDVPVRLSRVWRDDSEAEWEI